MLVIGFDKYYARMLELEVSEVNCDCIRIDTFSGIDAVSSAISSSGNYLCILNSDMPTYTGDLSLLLELLTVKRIKTALIGSKKTHGFFSQFIEGAPDLVRLFRKPFPVEELLTFIFTQQQMPYAPKSTSQITEIKISSNPHCASFDGNIVYFTPTEFKLLGLLISQNGAPLSREDIFKAIWKKDIRKGNPVDVYVRHIRKKFSQHFDIDVIKTVRNSGYAVNTKIRWKL